MKMQQLVQVLLPVRDNAGAPFPATHYAEIRRQLTERFGGMTAYTRSPAEGTFEARGGEVMRDEIVIVEVMCEQFEEQYWSDYRARLVALFSQEDLVVRVLPMRKL